MQLIRFRLISCTPRHRTPGLEVQNDFNHRYYIFTRSCTILLQARREHKEQTPPIHLINEYPVILVVTESKVQILPRNQIADTLGYVGSTYLQALRCGALEKVVQTTLNSVSHMCHVLASRKDKHTTTTARSPSLWTWNPPTVQLCLFSMSNKPGTPDLICINFSPPYLSSYRALTSRAVTFSLSGTDNVEMMPLNQGATEGMKATFMGLAGSASRLVRWRPASRSWMWSVSEYGRKPPARLSGVTLGTVVGLPSSSFVPATVPAPLYPEMPNTVGPHAGFTYFSNGAISSCVEVA